MKPLSKIIEEIGDKVLENTENIVIDEPRCFMSDNICTVCNGRGWYVVGGEACKCENYKVALDTQFQQDLVGLSGIKDIGKKTFASFNTEVSTKKREYTASENIALKNALLVAKGYAKNPDGWLVFEGTYGCGKTHLALAIANDLIHKKGMSIRFITATGLLDELRDTFSNDENSTASVMGKYQSAHIALILDDYGAEKSTEWAEEKLFQLLNHRHANKLPTIITTNLSTSQMPPRISSRMKESDVVKYVKINAPDYRAATSKMKSDARKNPVEKYESMTFVDWQIKDKYQEIAKETVIRWLEAKPRPVLYITGDYGVGKTHLAVALANKIHDERRGNVIFVTLRELSQKMHSSIDKNSKANMSDILGEHIKAHFLMIDDFNPKSISAWSMKEVFGILDERMVRRALTVITSAIPVSKLDKRLKTRLENETLCYELVIKEE